MANLGRSHKPWTVMVCPDCGEQRLGYPCSFCGSGLSADVVEVPRPSDHRGAVEERDRLRAMLKEAHDRDKWLGEMPPIAWYDRVADYFRGR